MKNEINKNIQPTMLKKIIIVMLISFSLTQLDLITIHHKCVNSLGPDFYGFPFIYRTEIPWVNSFEGNFYVSGFLGNMVFYIVLLLILIEGFKKLKINAKFLKYFRIARNISIVILLVLATFNFAFFEWNFKWRAIEDKNIEGQPLKYEKQLEFFKAGH